MQFKIIILCAIVGIISADPYDFINNARWHAFKRQYKKTYESPAVEDLRFKLFITNIDNIIKNNKKYDLGLVSYKLGINQFTDQFPSEVNKRMTCFNSSSIQANKFRHHTNHTRSFILPKDVVIPTKINWLEKGAVTAVKNQRQCSSCYAFAANGALEGQHYLATNQLISLSEQNIVDCSGSYGNLGCSGGWMTYVYEYIIDRNNINTEKDYPYVAREQTCQDIRIPGATLRSYVELPRDDEDILMKAVATQGPIAIAIDASQYSFHAYSDGIYYEPDCTYDYVTHAVLVVGYGTIEGVGDYWLVKNSWGDTWGKNGYMKMARNRNNNCCVACFGSFPTLG